MVLGAVGGLLKAAKLVKAILVGGAAVGLVAYERRRRKKQRAAAQDASAIELRETGSNDPVPILYGRTAANSTLAFPGEIGNNLPAVDKAFWSFGNLDRAYGKKNEFLLVQYVLGAGDISDVLDIWVDDLKMNELANNLAKLSRVKVQLGGPNAHSVMAERFCGGTYAGVRGTGSSRRDATATFHGLTYATAVFKHDREDPLFYGVPRPFFFVKGRKIRALNSDLTFGPEEYNSLTPVVLLDYLTNNIYGPNIPRKDIDLQSFYDAQQKAAVVIQGTNNALWNEPYPQKRNDLDTTSFSKWSDYFGALGFSDIAATGILDVAANPAADKVEGLFRHEYNGNLATRRDWQSAVYQILETWPGAQLFRKPDGRYKLGVPDSVTAEEDQVVATIEYSDTLSVTRNDPPDARRYNSYTIVFDNINKSFAEDSVIFPEPGGALDRRLYAADGDKRLHDEEKIEGCNNPYHARSIAAATVLTSRQKEYTIEMRLKGKLYEPLNVLRLKGGEHWPNLDDIIVVESVQEKDNGIVVIRAIGFDKDDYSYFSDELEVLAELDTYLVVLTDVKSVTATIDEGLVTVAWIPGDDESVNLLGYEIERSDDGGTTWKGGARVNADVTSWSELPSIAGIDKLRYRVRPRGSRNRVGNWVESADIKLSGTDFGEDSPFFERPTIMVPVRAAGGSILDATIFSPNPAQVSLKLIKGSETIPVQVMATVAVGGAITVALSGSDRDQFEIVQ